MGKADPGEQTGNFSGASVTMGNTEVKQMGVVEHGMLQRDEAREDQKDRRSKLFKVQGGAGGGK